MALSGRNGHYLVDTHCHLDDPLISSRLDTIIQKAVTAGVCKYVVPGVAPENWARIELTASRNDSVYPAYGIHPLFADRWSGTIREKLLELLPKAVAIGEIGLDSHYSDQPRIIQARTFRQQLKMAVNAGLPVLIHCRGAFRDLLDILAQENVSKVGGIMHAFSGSPEIAKECIRLGLHISVAGPVTYCNAVRPVRVVQEIPIESIVLETDSPDLAPEPYRGFDNEPAFLPVIAEMVANIKGIPYAEVAEISTFSATNLLGL